MTRCFTRGRPRPPVVLLISTAEETRTLCWDFRDLPRRPDLPIGVSWSWARAPATCGPGATPVASDF